MDDNSLNELSVPVDKVCAANCQLTILVSIPRQKDTSIGIPDGLKVHPLFDPALPHTEVFYEDITVHQVGGDYSRNGFIPTHGLGEM